MLSAELISDAREWNCGIHSVASTNSDSSHPTALASGGSARRIITKSIKGLVEINQYIDQRDRTFVNFIFAL